MQYSNFIIWSWTYNGSGVSTKCEELAPNRLFKQTTFHSTLNYKNSHCHSCNSPVADDHFFNTANEHLITIFGSRNLANDFLFELGCFRRMRNAGGYGFGQYTMAHINSSNSER